MRWLKKYELFKESKTYSNKNLISEICVSMVLLNNEFLDKILDMGLKSRYTENSAVFLTDLKNLLLAKNRLNLGKFVDDKFITDEEISKINGIFDSVNFDIEKDWKVLIDSRTTARAIIDKILSEQKLEPSLIKNIFWIGPNKEDEYQEDIVIELVSGKQYSIFLNKNISQTKTASFTKFAEDIIGGDIDNLFGDEYIDKWDKLTQEWVKLIYENSKKNIQAHIEKFIEPSRIDTIGYFEYFDIKHSESRFKHLGEFMSEFDRNILNFSDLMSEIWKKRETLFIDSERVSKQWYETKVIILNSRILENLLTNSLKLNFSDNIKRLESGYKRADGVVKMKLVKTVVEKMGCLERDIYYVGNRGESLHMIPSRDFFRNFYDDISVNFDYHVKFLVSKDEENNDFKIKILLELDGEKLTEIEIIVKFSGGEMSGKLSAKYKFNLSENFNYQISKKNN